MKANEQIQVVEPNPKMLEILERLVGTNERIIEINSRLVDMLADTTIIIKEKT